MAVLVLMTISLIWIETKNKIIAFNDNISFMKSNLRFIPEWRQKKLEFKILPFYTVLHLGSIKSSNFLLLLIGGVG